MPEKVLLDPSEVADSRTELDITPWVKSDGIDWGDAEIEQYLAEAQRGQVPVDHRIPNRQIQIPLVLQDKGGTAFAIVRANFQAKAALFQREGGWIKRVTASGGTVYADLTGATLRMPGSWSQAHKDFDTEARLDLEAIPDFYGDEVMLSDHTETTKAELVFTETGIDGDYPARVRLVVDNDDRSLPLQAVLGLIWGFRSRHYSADATAALAYEAEALTPMGTAAAAALSGASGGTVVTHGSADSADWTSILSTEIDGVGGMTHTGTYRVWGRMRSTSGTTVRARLIWTIGDTSVTSLVVPVENTPWRVPGASDFFLADLGEVRLDEPPIGTHAWQGQVQFRGDSGGEDLSIDKVWLAPVDDGYGKISAPTTAAHVIDFEPASAELRWDGCFRSEQNDAWSKLIPEGDLPRLPPSGLEGRTVEVFVKASPGDLDEEPDDEIMDISAQLHYRPSWLIVPG